MAHHGPTALQNATGYATVADFLMHSGPEQPQAAGQVPGVRVGATIAGKYRVDRLLGSGGMGQVFQAHHLALDQAVAIKCLLPQASTSQTMLARFQREARVSVKIRSEHVARTLDVGNLPDGTPFIVMEFLQGIDLEELLKRDGPLTPERTCTLILQACEALAEAHALGIVHRDLKLANLFLTTRADGSECLKVLDFGISKLQSDEVALTHTSALIGSPRFMSPEQLTSAKNVDARADIWALGVVMYALLSGELPFSSASLAELVLKITGEVPAPIQQHRANVPQGLDEVVSRCLSKSAAGRFASVAQLANALAPFGDRRANESAARISSILPEPPTTTEDATQETFSRTAGGATTPGLTQATLPVAGMRRSQRGLWLALGLVLSAGLLLVVYYGVQPTGQTAAVLAPPPPSLSNTPAHQPKVELVPTPPHSTAPPLPSVEPARSTVRIAKPPLKRKPPVKADLPTDRLGASIEKNADRILDEQAAGTENKDGDDVLYRDRK